MIARKDIEQGTEEWYKVRWGKVSGTRAKSLFTKGDDLLHTLLSEITEPFELEDGYVSDDMQRGKDLEPEARRALSQYIKVPLFEVGWLQSSEHEISGISIDAINADETITAEIKCPGSKKHIETVLADIIPLDHIHQCLHAFSVNPKLQTHYFFSFRPEAIKPLFIKSITRDSFMNIGTKANPVMLNVDEYVSQSHAKLSALEQQIKNSIEILKF